MPSNNFLRALLIISIIAIHKTCPTYADENHYCGSNWMAASQSCADPCPNNDDAECPAGLTCYGYTGCADKLAKADETGAPSAKPTPRPRRTKRPTPIPAAVAATEQPTAEPTKIGTSSPTKAAGPPPPPPTAQPTKAAGAPTQSPIVRPLLQTINANGGNSGLNSEIITSSGGGDGNLLMSTASQRSYGMIFDIQTSEGSPAIEIVGLEFYSPVRGANVAYEVWTKSGTWHGFEGRDRAFTLVARGNVTTWGRPGSNANSISAGSRFEGGNLGSSGGNANDGGGEPTRIPSSKFTPIKVDGGGARQSIYITLTTKDLLYARSSTQSGGNALQSISSIEEVYQQTEDTIILQQTPELTLFEGAAVMIHPFEKANQRIYYRMPRGFVGRVFYHRSPCEEYYSDDAVVWENGTTSAGTVEPVRWEDCNEVKERERIPSTAELGPFFSDVEEGDRNDENGNAAAGGTNNGENSGMYNGTIPTSSPTKTAQPTIYTMKINLVLLLRNVASNRILDENEQEAFQQAVMEFYVGQSLLDVNEVEILGSDVWYQQVFVEGLDDEDGERRKRRLGGTAGPRSDSRRLQDAASIFGDAGAAGGEEEGGGGPASSAGAFGAVESPAESPASSAGAFGAAESPASSAGAFGGAESPASSAGAFGAAEDSQAAGVQGEAIPETAVDGEAGGMQDKLIPETSGNETTAGPVPSTEVDGAVDEPIVGPMPPDDVAYAPATLAEEDGAPSTISLEVTLVVSVLYSPLPLRITQELLQTLLRNNEGAFVRRLRDHPDLSWYFAPLDGMPSVIAVDELTLPPTRRPTRAPTPVVVSLSDSTQEESGLSGPMTALAIFGFLYASLATVSMCYVKRARQRFRIERQKRILVQNGGGGGANERAGHGMVYEEEGKRLNDGRDLRRSASMLGSLGKSFRGGLKGSFKKDRVDDDGETEGLVAEKAREQYRNQRSSDINNGDESSYYSEEEEELSSMEDSYYSSEEGSEDYSESGSEESEEE